MLYEIDQQSDGASTVKISIITVCLNNVNTIECAISSVLKQTYKDVEYIVVDGGSVDGTLQILEKYDRRIAKIISEPDAGMYDAMNKGIRHCTGDIIGILNSDDFYESEEVLGKAISAFSEEIDTVFGNVRFVDRDKSQEEVRFVDASSFKPWHLRFGWMPPHPATFVRTEVFRRFGNYKTDYTIAADYEFFIRTLLVGKARSIHNPDFFVTMRAGGASTSGLQSTIVITREILRGCRENGIYSNALLVWSRLPVKFVRQKLIPSPYVPGRRVSDGDSNNND